MQWSQPRLIILRESGDISETVSLQRLKPSKSRCPPPTESSQIPGCQIKVKYIFYILHHLELNFLTHPCKYNKIHLLFSQIKKTSQHILFGACNIEMITRVCFKCTDLITCLCLQQLLITLWGTSWVNGSLELMSVWKSAVFHRLISRLSLRGAHNGFTAREQGSANVNIICIKTDLTCCVCMTPVLKMEGIQQDCSSLMSDKDTDPYGPVA